jgi:hypothetical protein
MKIENIEIGMFEDDFLAGEIVQRVRFAEPVHVEKGSLKLIIDAQGNIAKVINPETEKEVPFECEPVTDKGK